MRAVYLLDTATEVIGVAGSGNLGFKRAIQDKTGQQKAP